VLDLDHLRGFDTGSRADSTTAGAFGADR